MKRLNVANKKSAAKRARQTIIRTARNRAVKSNVRTQVRKFREAVEAKDVSTESVDTQLRAAASQLARAATKGVLHKRTAARRISRLAKAANKAKAAATAQV